MGDPEASEEAVSGDPQSRLVATAFLPPGSALEINFTTGEVLGMEPFWFYWLTIARRQAVEAERLASELGQPDRSGQIMASLVAVTAAAHAIDSLYGAVSKLIPRTRTTAARHRQILEALKLGFSLGRRQHEWAPELAWLFALRDKAVHHAEGAEAAPFEFDAAGAIVARSAESQAYTPGNARRAADLALSIAVYCLQHPKANTREWAESRRGLCAALTALRE